MLSIPATGAGVERMFNYARDICHYRRGSLNSMTIQNLMMYMCSSRFEMEEELLAYLKESFDNEDIFFEDEEQVSPLPQNSLYLISDNEKDDSLTDQIQITGANQ